MPSSTSVRKRQIVNLYLTDKNRRAIQKDVTIYMLFNTATVKRCLELKTSSLLILCTQNSCSRRVMTTGWSVCAQSSKTFKPYSKTGYRNFLEDGMTTMKLFQTSSFLFPQSARLVRCLSGGSSFDVVPSERYGNAFIATKKNIYLRRLYGAVRNSPLLIPFQLLNDLSCHTSLNQNTQRLPRSAQDNSVLKQVGEISI